MKLEKGNELNIRGSEPGGPSVEKSKALLSSLSQNFKSFEL